jgi:hypothetical protein
MRGSLKVELGGSNGCFLGLHSYPYTGLRRQHMHLILPPAKDICM